MRYRKRSENWHSSLPLFAPFFACNAEVPQAATKGTKHDFGCKACHDIHYPKGRALWATPLSKTTGTHFVKPVMSAIRGRYE